MTALGTERLALLGGTPVRREPLPVPPRATGDGALANVQQVLESGLMNRHAKVWVRRLEEEFAAFYGVRHCTASTSGTSAIHLAVGALNPDPGDEIITAPITDMGTVIPILAQNAIPVFADVQRETFNLDPLDVERRITSRTRAIIPVHLGGNPCDMDALLDIARRHHLMLIEDCSQAYCASYQGSQARHGSRVPGCATGPSDREGLGGRWTGTMGDIGCFSMQQSKHFTVGDGGLTITDDEELGRKIALFADKGWPRYSAEGARTYESFGFNYHMTELQGAVAVSELPLLRGVCERRTRNGERLTELLRGLPGIHPQLVQPGNHSTYWFFALRAVEAETGVPPQRFAEAVRAEGVSCGYQYIGKPIFLYEALRRKRIYGSSTYPFSLQDPAQAVRYEVGECPNCEAALDEMLTVPLHESWGERELQDIADAFHKVSAAATHLRP
jgi:dTDP-4-amino-4,6-dideoxygalactose transaminase